MKKLLALILVLVLSFSLPQVVSAAPDEAIGRVISILSGDSFGIQIVKPDARTKEIDRVKLADVVSPSTLEVEGKVARRFTDSMLKNRTVYLDIDESSPGGRNDMGLLICVVYLLDPEYRPVWPPYNRILVDSGNATVNDENNNEFDASSWGGAPPKMKINRLSIEKARNVNLNPQSAGTGGVVSVASDAQNSVMKVDSSTRQVSIGSRARRAS